jgi:hypothetical protein
LVCLFLMLKAHYFRESLVGHYSTPIHKFFEIEYNIKT